MDSGTRRLCVVLFDRSISMSYGHREPKIREAVRATTRYLFNISKFTGYISILAFDHLVDIIQQSAEPEEGKIEDALSGVSARGLTNIATAVDKAHELITGHVGGGDILLVTDGRVNFGLSGGGSEGDSKIIDEVLRSALSAITNRSSINVIAVGEDSFDDLLRSIASDTGGQFIYSETALGGSNFERPLLTLSCTLHGIPEELPAGKPTWTKELNTPHVIVASDEAAKTYVGHRMAFLSTTGGRRIRVYVASVHENVLEQFCMRRPSRAEEVRSGRSILVDAANRKALGLKPGDTGELTIY